MSVCERGDVDKLDGDGLCGVGLTMAGMFSPEMMKMAQEQMANITPDQMAAMQQQVRVSCRNNPLHSSCGGGIHIKVLACGSGAIGSTSKTEGRRCPLPLSLVDLNFGGFLNTSAVKKRFAVRKLCPDNDARTTMGDSKGYGTAHTGKHLLIVHHRKGHGSSHKHLLIVHHLKGHGTSHKHLLIFYH